MNGIARYTTPSISFKPRAVDVADVDEIFLVLKQNDKEIIRKSMTDATIVEDTFVWTFSQEETAALDRSVKCTAQIDYKAGVARYTTAPKTFAIMESAIEEVI